MRTSFLNSEFIQVPTYGTMSMLEKRSFFGSKMMDIEDEILVDQQTIVFKEDPNTKEQTTAGAGSEVNNTSYNFDVLKSNYHTITFNSKQTQEERIELTSWELVLDVDALLEDYLFAKIKQARAFLDVYNSFTKDHNVDLAIRSYIVQNLMKRIEVKRINFYVQNFAIIDNPALLKYDPKYNLQVKLNAITKTGDAKLDNVQIDKNLVDNTLIVIYNQKKNALQYKFDYYFDVVFGKI